MSVGNANVGADLVNERPERRSAAFAFTDVVGYSAFMAQDEAGTHARWMATRNHLIIPLLQTHHGRLVKSTGDGVLVEFDTPLDAVEWSRAVQASSNEAQDVQQDASESLIMRISIHLGEVIEADGDIYGDDVNIAARLQEHAEPGGIVISQAVFDRVEALIDITTRNLGPIYLKNTPKPVQAYALGPWSTQVRTGVPTAAEKLPSIAVLPLQNLGGNPANDYFGDGIVEDVIVSLSALRELFVISRATTLRFAGERLSPREVGRILGVRYVLMGSVRLTATQVRVTTQLCDAFTGEIIWGDSTEVPFGELFDVQDSIVEQIVSGIAPHIRESELKHAMRKRPGNLSAYDATLRALDIINSLDLDTFKGARDYLEQAMTDDPDFAMAHAWAARWYSLHVGQGWSKTPKKDAAEAMRLAARAIDLDRQNALALATFGHLKSFLYHDYDSALVYLERARRASPNSALAWVLSSATMSYLDRAEEALEHANRGLRLSPFDQSLFYFYNVLSLAHFTEGS